MWLTCAVTIVHGSQENPTSGEYLGRTFGLQLLHGSLEQVAIYDPPIHTHMKTLQQYTDLTSHFGADDDGGGGGSGDDKLDNNEFVCVYTRRDVVCARMVYARVCGKRARALFFRPHNSPRRAVARGRPRTPSLVFVIIISFRATERLTDVLKQYT